MRTFLKAGISVAILAVVFHAAYPWEDPGVPTYEYYILKEKSRAYPEVQELIFQYLEDDKINYRELSSIETQIDAVELQRAKDILRYYLKEEIGGRLVRQNGERPSGNCKVYRPKLFPRVPCQTDPPTPSNERPKKTQTGKNWVRSCPGYLQRNRHDQVVHQSKGELEYDSSPNPTACTERFFPQVASSDKR